MIAEMLVTIQWKNFDLPIVRQIQVIQIGQALQNIRIYFFKEVVAQVQCFECQKIIQGLVMNELTTAIKFYLQIQNYLNIVLSCCPEKKKFAWTK